MFGRERQEVLEKGFWGPNHGGTTYLDVWSPSRDGGPPDGCHDGRMQDDELEDWLYQRGSFQSPTLRRPPSVRLLFCDRVGWKPLGFALSRASYLKIEEAFALGEQVLPVISKNSGQHMCRLGYSPTGVLESVEFTIKWPQMYQIGNCGFVFKHDFATQTTRGFLHGWDMVTPTDQVPTTTHYDASGGTWDARIREYYYDNMSSSSSSSSLVSHPLFMPAMMLAEHVRSADRYRGTLSRHLAFVEQELGVTRVGQASWRTTKQFAAVQRLISSRRDRMNLTAELNSCVTDATNFGTVLGWIVRHAEFLKTHMAALHRLRPHPDPRAHREMEEFLDLVADDALSVKAQVESFKARFELQLSVLYNFVAQVDNDLNMRIAYRAGLDGTAMKTLAYVTTIFLPPTFIATLFSMSMFDWQASVSTNSDSDSDTVVVVPDFWIYWVVSVPLTLAILGGWRLWLRREKNALLAEYGILQQERQQQQEEQYQQQLHGSGYNNDVNVNHSYYSSNRQRGQERGGRGARSRNGEREKSVGP